MADNLDPRRMVPAILVLIVFALAVYIHRLRKGNGPWEERQVIIALFVATTLLHFQLASVGWLLRYEAYRIALGLFAIAAAAPEYLPVKSAPNQSLKHLATALVLIIVLQPFVPKIRGGLPIAL